MKKVFLLSFSLVMAVGAFAQVPVKKTELSKQCVTVKVQNPNEAEAPAMSFGNPVMPKASVKNYGKSFEEFVTMTTNYDKQSNGSIGNRIAVFNDGTASIVATWDQSGSTSYPNRGAGYNYYDGEAFGDEPLARIEDVKSGWPSICAAGNAEILASHATGSNIYRRATKGQGDWELVTNLAAPQWPRVCASGNGQYVHFVGCESGTDANGNSTYNNWYSRSTDNGLTWSDPVTPPLVNEDDYYHNIGADDYVMASNGDNIAILFGGLTYELFYIISHDNGENWEKQVVAHFPYGHGLDWYQTEITKETDSIWYCDNSQSIAIDDNGVVHVAFGLTRWAPAPESGFGYITYWPYTDAIVYWNSEYVNEQGGHDIPLFGDWSGDTNWQEWTATDPTHNGTNGVSSSLMDDRLIALAEADGNQHLHVFGWPDEDGDGVVDYTEYWDGEFTYVNYGIATTPSIAIDHKGNMAIVYSVLSESRVCQAANFYYRSAYVTYRDKNGIWNDDSENLSDGFEHMMDEVYPTWACPNSDDNGNLWIGYSSDDTPGLMLDDDDPQTELTDNFIFAIKLTTFFDDVNEVVNPLTEVAVYPNPSVNGTIYVNASMSSDATVEFHNIAGQLVKTVNKSLNTGANSISVNDLTSGVYFCTVTANGYSKTTKLVVK